MSRTCERPPRGASRSGRSEDKKNAATQTPIATVLAGHDSGDQAQNASVHALQRAQRRAVELRPRLEQLGLARELADDVLRALRDDLVAAENWRTGRGALEVLSAGRSRARAIEEARRPRPGDFPGGRVPLWGPGGAA